MSRDSRAGVRRLARTLQRERKRAKEEQLRQEMLLNFEKVLWNSGIEHIAGVDEAGIGPLAGPVVAAAVVFPPASQLAGIDDSKKLEEETRIRLNRKIQKMARVGIGVVEVAEVDRINVYQAGLLAMRRAVEALPNRPQHVLVDARKIPDLDLPQNCFNRGDGLSFSIAAASIVAKVHRDRLMAQLAQQHPGYGLDRHKGYATPAHQKAIRRLGPSPVHRRSFPFIRELCGEFSPAFYRLKEELDQVDTAPRLRRLESRLEENRESLADEEWKKLRLVASRRWKTVR